YPEITGYYLQWLAWHAARYGVEAELRRRAGAAQTWLAGWLAKDDAPKTRLYLRSAAPDWRNQALFCFDLAMALRGIASAAHMKLLDVDRELVSRLAQRLLQMVAEDGLLRACRPHAAGCVLPVRWSTRRGAFLAKAAAGIANASMQLPGVPRELSAAAEATFAASLEWFVREPHDETHALLY